MYINIYVHKCELYRFNLTYDYYCVYNFTENNIII